MLYSGTVAAAIEGAFFRRTSIAVSLEYTKPKPLNFPRAAELRPPSHRADRCSSRCRRGRCSTSTFPAWRKGPVAGRPRGAAECGPYVETYDRRIDPRGRVYFWSGPDFRCPDPHPDTDVTRAGRGYITVTPLQFDLTHGAAVGADEGLAMDEGDVH